MFTLHEGDSQALAAEQYGRNRPKYRRSVNKLKSRHNVTYLSRHMIVAPTNHFGNRFKQMAPIGEIVTIGKPDYMCSSKTSMQLLPFRVPGKRNEWVMKCRESSQGPHGIPGEEVSRFASDAYFKFEKFLVRLHCTALTFFQFDRARLPVCLFNSVPVIRWNYNLFRLAVVPSSLVVSCLVTRPIFHLRLNNGHANNIHAAWRVSVVLHTISFA